MFRQTIFDVVSNFVGGGRWVWHGTCNGAGRGLEFVFSCDFVLDPVRGTCCSASLGCAPPAAARGARVLSAGLAHPGRCRFWGWPLLSGSPPRAPPPWALPLLGVAPSCGLRGARLLAGEHWVWVGGCRVCAAGRGARGASRCECGRWAGARAARPRRITAGALASIAGASGLVRRRWRCTRAA